MEGKKKGEEEFKNGGGARTQEREKKRMKRKEKRKERRKIRGLDKLFHFANKVIVEFLVSEQKLASQFSEKLTTTFHVGSY